MKNYLVLILLTVTFACGNKDPKPSENKTNFEYLTGSGSKTWVLTAGTATDGSLSIDLMSKQDPCIVDNELILKSDKTYTLNEGATKCNDDDPDLIYEATWALKDNDTKMTIDKFNFLGVTVENPEFTIIKLDDNTFQGTTQMEYQGTTYDLELTFGAK